MKYLKHRILNKFILSFRNEILNSYLIVQRLKRSLCNSGFYRLIVVAEIVQTVDVVFIIPDYFKATQNWQFYLGMKVELLRKLFDSDDR